VILRSLLSARSAREIAVAIAFVARSGLGWVVAAPAISAVTALGTGSLETGDRALFAPSGLVLVELLRRGQVVFTASAAPVAMLFGVALLVSALSTALLFSVFSPGEPDLRRALRSALANAPRFALIGCVELVAGGLLVLAGRAIWPALRESSASSALIPLAAAFAVGLLALSSIVGDLLRAEITAAERTLRDGLERAIEALRGAPLTLAGGYVLATGLGALGVALAARGVELVRVELEGAWRVVLAFLFHQAALLLLTLIQSRWAGRLGRIVERPW
jgi:hypothetical protein